jgi:hypothetical protein
MGHERLLVEVGDSVESMMGGSRMVCSNILLCDNNQAEVRDQK